MSATRQLLTAEKFVKLEQLISCQHSILKKPIAEKLDLPDNPMSNTGDRRLESIPICNTLHCIDKISLLLAIPIGLLLFPQQSRIAEQTSGK